MSGGGGGKKSCSVSMQLRVSLLAPAILKREHFTAAIGTAWCYWAHLAKARQRNASFKNIDSVGSLSTAALPAEVYQTDRQNAWLCVTCFPLLPLFLFNPALATSI
jgi:hypothetical protein